MPLFQGAFETIGKSASDSIYLNLTFVFSVNGYLLALFMATIDKFYAVTFPFNYGKKRATIFRTAIAITTGFNAALSTVIAVFGTSGRLGYSILLGIYNTNTLLIFLTISILYILIIAQLVRNQRNLSKVNARG